MSSGSSAGCGGGDSGQDVNGNTVSLTAVRENEFIIQARAMDDPPGGQWTPGTGSKMILLTNDGKTVSGYAYCVVGNRNVRSIQNGHLEGVLQRITIREKKPK